MEEEALASAEPLEAFSFTALDSAGRAALLVSALASCNSSTWETSDSALTFEAAEVFATGFAVGTGFAVLLAMDSVGEGLALGCSSKSGPLPKPTRVVSTATKISKTAAEPHNFFLPNSFFILDSFLPRQPGPLFIFFLFFILPLIPPPFRDG